MPLAARKLCPCGRIRNADEACVCGVGSRRSSTWQSSPLYKTRRWINRSKAHRKHEQLCRQCKAAGIVKAGDVADHIVPWTNEQEFFEGDLQALCFSHHGKKSQSERRNINYGNDLGLPGGRIVASGGPNDRSRPRVDSQPNCEVLGQ
jgi:hypothetical protein